MGNHRSSGNCVTMQVKLLRRITCAMVAAYSRAIWRATLHSGRIWRCLLGAMRKNKTDAPAVLPCMLSVLLH